LDGVTWTQIRSEFIPMNDPVVVGLFVDSENSPLLVGATFDNVRIAPPQPPVLAFAGFDNNGAGRITLECFPGWTNRIEISSDLVHWQSWTNLFNFSGSASIGDPAAQSNPTRFYRSLIEY
jgi:hypothetical protein